MRQHMAVHQPVDLHRHGKARGGLPWQASEKRFQ